MKLKWIETATHASLAVAEKDAPGAGKRLIVTGFLVSSDLADAVVTLVEDAAGTPVIKLQFRMGPSSYAPPFAWKLSTPIVIIANKKVTLSVAGTAACAANLLGVITNN